MPVTDETRVRFKTYIAKELLETLDGLAQQEETHVGYLIENGLKNLIVGFIDHKYIVVVKE